LVFFVLFVAVLNLAIGYGLAVYLHGGSSMFPDGWSLPMRLTFLSAGKEPDDENERALSASNVASRDGAPQAASSATGSTLSTAHPANSTSAANPNGVLATAGDFYDDASLDPRLAIEEPATAGDSGR
jgi:hypothetical protein